MDRLTFDQLFLALPGPHMIVDESLTFAAVNGAYEATTNRRRADLVGRNLFECFPAEGEARDRVENSIRRAFASGQPDTLAFIEYKIPRSSDPRDGFEHRFWSAIHSPLKDSAGRVIFVLQNTVDITEIVRLRTVVGGDAAVPASELALLQRTQEVEEAYRASRSQLDRFKHLFEQAPGMVALLRGPDHVFTFANRAYRVLAGDRELVGLSMAEVFSDREARGLADLLDKVLKTGVAASGSDLRVLLRTPDGTLRELFLDISFNPIRSETGEVEGIFVQGYDRTENVRADQRQRLLIDELNHRVKNTLSTIQSLARPYFHGEKDRGEARATFEARILTLSNAHNLLSDRHWESAELATILRLELAALDVDRVEVDGDGITLNPKAAIALAMVFHELASNALKYGALSHSAGRLRIAWHRHGDTVSIAWRELWPAEDIRIERGFGMRMLERIVKGELDGRLNTDVGDGGLVWTIEVPMIEIEDIPRLVVS
ncbi:PAS domain-containing protein [Aureimonas sp. ME7]|uniref:sensor histidine kinase n=1 Tax=Aureimonas sp. ME7 TaxID=2744252 RepID=UPI0015F5AB5E|nr:PAS domain-containing protein [Aureimonas sp. ME7]